MRWIKIPTLVFVLAVGLLCGSCGLLKHTPQKEETIITYKDSTIVHIKDSIRVIPVERYVNIVALPDTLHLETSLATADAYYDSTFNALRGEMHNKKEIEEHYKVVYKDKVVLKDTTIYKEIPIEVEKPVRYIPKWCWWSLVLNILSIVFLGIKVYFKFFK